MLFGSPDIAKIQCFTEQTYIRALGIVMDPIDSGNIAPIRQLQAVQHRIRRNGFAVKLQAAQYHAIPNAPAMNDAILQIFGTYAALYSFFRMAVNHGEAEDNSVKYARTIRADIVRRN